MEPQPTLPLHKRRWFQYRLRTLLVGMLLASVGLSWFAVRLRHQRELHIAKIVVAYPGSSPSVAHANVVRDFVFQAVGLPYERVVTVSSQGRAEVYIVARGIDAEDLLHRVRAISVRAVPEEATVQQVTLLDPGAGIPQVDTKPVDALRIDVDGAKCAALSVSISAISETVSRQSQTVSQGDVPPITDQARALEESFVESGFQTHGPIRLKEVAAINITQEPKYVVWEFPAGGVGHPVDQSSESESLKP